MVIFDPSKPVAVAQLTVTVANTGDGPAGLFRVTVQLPDGSLATGTTIAPLAPHTQVDVPITAYIAHAGDTLLKVIADYDNVIPETNKSDNVLSYTLNVVQATAVPNAPTATPTLTYTPPPTSTNTSTPTNTATLVPTGVTLPNLVIRGIQINPDPGVILKGTTTGNIQVVVRVANIGNGPAGTFLIGLALSDGRQVAAQAPALNPGKETNVTLTVPFTQPGQYHLLATADSGNTITETSKADNAFARDILIQDQNANVPTVTATITSNSAAGYLTARSGDHERANRKRCRPAGRHCWRENGSQCPGHHYQRGQRRCATLPGRSDLPERTAVHGWDIPNAAR